MAGNQDKFENAMNLGHSAAWDQAWAKAAAYYQQALEEFPTHPGALSSLALAMFEQKDFDNALLYYEKTLESSPEDPIPHDKIGQIQEQRGMLPEAIRSFHKAAELFIKSREIDKAIDCWNKVVTIKPDHLNARTRLAMIHERRGKKDEAVEEYLATASIMQHQGEAQRAIQVVEYCLQIAPEHDKAKNALALLRSNQLLPKPTRPRGGTGPVRMTQVKERQKSQGGEPKPLTPVEEAYQKALIRIASLLFDQADLASEERPTQKRELSTITHDAGALVKDQSRGGKAALHLGQAIDAQTRSDDNQTLVELEKALATGLNHPALHYLIGLIYSRKESGKALKHLKNAFAHPDYALGAHMLMGRYHFNLSDYNEAVLSYLRALSIADSETVPASKSEDIRQLYEPIIEMQTRRQEGDSLKEMCQKIENHLNRHDWLSHLSALRKHLPEREDGSPLPIADLLLSSGSDVVDSITRIKELSAKQQYYSALEEAFFALGKAPTFLPLHIMIGETMLQQGKTRDAVNKFTLVADLYNLRGEAGQAIRMLERVSEMAPMNLKIRSQLVEMLLHQGRVLPAVEQLRQIADVYYQLADLEKARQTYTEAIHLLKQSKADSPLLVELIGIKADIDLQHLDFREAIRSFEQIRSIEPENVSARIRLIDLYFRLGHDHAAITELDQSIQSLKESGQEQAIIPFLQDLINEVPDKLEIRKRLADHLLKQGRRKETIEQLDVIADALLEMGNRESALRVVKTIIALKPENISEYQALYTQLSRS